MPPAPGGRDATDLAGDRGRLGLGQVDMGDRERHRRVAGGTDLGAQAGWRLARSARAAAVATGSAAVEGQPAAGSAGPGGGGVGSVVGSSRIVLR